jgi:general secretion pathway protein J
MKVHSHRRQKAFSLIEVLISMALLGALTVTIWQSMSASFGAKDAIEKLNERYHEGRQVIRRMTRELRMAFLRAQPPEEMQEEDPAVVTQFIGEEDEINFPTTAHIRLRAETKESDQAEIEYFLKKPDYDVPYRGKTLFRRESRRVDHKPEKGGITWPVLDGVKEFKLEYWDDSKEIGDDAWQDSWDSDDKKMLPSRIRITLELERGQGLPPIRFVAQSAPRIRRPIQPIVDYKR